MSLSKKVFSVLAIFTVLAVISPRHALADWLIDRSGSLVRVDGSVLGDDDEPDSEDSESSSNSSEDEQESHDSEDSDSSGSSDDSNDSAEQEAAKQEQERIRELQKKQQEAAKQKLEKEIENRQRILEQRRESIKSFFEFQNGKLKVKQEFIDQNGNVIRKTETEIEDDENLHVEGENGELLTVNFVGDDELELHGERVRTRTHFPITIGANGELIITKPDGTEKTVTVLPDAALKNLEQKGFEIATSSAELAEDEEGEPVYEFETLEEKRIFGLFRSSFKGKTTVSAETGEVVGTESQETSFFRRLFEALSF